MFKVKLRDYQEECVKTIQKHFEGRDRQLIQIPTGGGKTFIFLAYIARNSTRSLTIVPSRELLEQVEESSHHFLPKGSCYARKNGKWKPAGHYIVTAQSLNFESSKEFMLSNKFDTIIIDEAHKAQAPTYSKFITAYIEKYPKTKILGLTATPERHDQKSLIDIFHELTFSKNIYDMIIEGHLCDIESYRIKTGQKFETRKLQNGDFSPISLKSLDNETRNNLIIKTFTENCREKKTIIFCVSVDQARKLEESFQKLGVCCESIYGDMSYAERKDILLRFKGGITQVVTNCQLLTEGFDEPSIDAIIMARPTKSKTLYCQMIGRGLRNYKNKEVCYLYELTDSVHNICTFNMAAKQDFELEYEYRNGSRLTDLKKELDSINISELYLTKEKISLYQDVGSTFNCLATENQKSLLNSKNVKYYEPITLQEAGFLLWKESLRKKIYG